MTEFATQIIYRALKRQTTVIPIALSTRKAFNQLSPEAYAFSVMCGLLCSPLCFAPLWIDVAYLRLAHTKPLTTFLREGKGNS